MSRLRPPLPGFASVRDDQGAPIDHAHLRQFAMGDPALERRFLIVFAEHAKGDLVRLWGSDTEDLGAFVHSLKSSASSIGAWRVLATAEAVLALKEEAGSSIQRQRIDELARSIEEAMQYIEKVLAS